VAVPSTLIHVSLQNEELSALNYLLGALPLLDGPPPATSISDTGLQGSAGAADLKLGSLTELQGGRVHLPLPLLLLGLEGYRQLHPYSPIRVVSCLLNQTVIRGTKSKHCKICTITEGGSLIAFE